MKLLPFILFLVFFLQTSKAIIINEIMADPVSDESLNEWGSENK